MDWVQYYQLFLFDFDGLLVNTEELHFKAYRILCEKRGLALNWDMRTYGQAAWFQPNGLQEALYAALPALKQYEPCWDVLHQEKKQIYLDLILEGEVALMPGVGNLLKELKDRNIQRCVVTHSPEQQVKLIRKQNPLLDTIPHWITRENYRRPKPHPECYLHAIAQLARPEDRIIGFEDSPRGLKALLETRAEGVLVSSFFDRKALSTHMPKVFFHCASLEDLARISHLHSSHFGHLFY